MHGAILPILQYAFMAWCSVKEAHLFYTTREQPNPWGRVHHEKVIVAKLVIWNSKAYNRFQKSPPLAPS
jgi:hypothetical protein